ncbi:MAG TPA: hypothetical protein VIX11_16265 [Candidatus Acidoferrum sp.]
MPLPETIAMRFTEEDAGYVTVRPVVKQTFRLGELADMVVSVTGKSIARVQQIFRAGTVVYNGYRYWWDGFGANEIEIAGLLNVFPDDDPALLFNPARVTAVTLEIGGGTQRMLVRISRGEAAGRKLFHKQSPWEILLGAAKDSSPRYEKYSHAERAEVYRLQLSFEAATTLLKQAAAASSRGLRKRFAALQPPAAFLFFIPRTKSAGAGTAP